MIIVDSSVVVDWFFEHKKTRNFLVFLILLCLMYCVFIREAIKNYDTALVLKNSLKQQLMMADEIIEGRENDRRLQSMKLAKIETQYLGRNELNTSPMSISDYYNRCGIKKYTITDSKGSSSGGHGRPTLLIESTLNYDRVFCVLSNFSKDSNDVEFKAMTLNRDENKKTLKWILDVYVSD